MGSDRGAGQDEVRSPRLLELLELAESHPDLAALEPYLHDADPQVRRSAVATVTEVAPDGTGPALAARLLDEDPAVRASAAVALRELVEVLPADELVRSALLAAVDAPDPLSRTAVLDVLRALRLGDGDLFRAATRDDDQRVRLMGVHGLVSLDDVAGVAAARHDPAREVRVAVAHGLGTIGSWDGTPALVELAADREALVRAAALEAAATLGPDSGLVELCVAGAAAEEWQVRVGAARGLAAAPAETALPVLAAAVTDVHADVRKAAVIAITAWTGLSEADDALEVATKDSDADVRGYARRALRGR